MKRREMNQKLCVRHELAHALIASAYGMPVHGIEVTVDQSGQYSLSGQCNVTLLDLKEGLAVMYAAGIAQDLRDEGYATFWAASFVDRRLDAYLPDVTGVGMTGMSLQEAVEKASKILDWYSDVVEYVSMRLELEVENAVAQLKRDGEPGPYRLVWDWDYIEGLIDWYKMGLMEATS